jgi:CRISPR-associated protein Cst2
MENIKGILVSMLVPMENHMANCGEKLLGNASSIKRRPDGKVYISGQMQRHALFSAIERLNQDDPQKGNTFVSNADGVGSKIEIDLRADMGGFLHPSKGDYSGRRIAPLTVTPAVAIKKSEVGRDLLIRIKQNEGGDQKQALVTKEFSEFDLMQMNFFLDISSLSLSKAFKYENEFHIETLYFKHATETERKRRVKLFLEATKSITDYANQARNAVSGEPQKVLVVFDTKLSRKASRYFSGEETQRNNIIQELIERKAEYFVGNDIDSKTSVLQAYNAAFELLASSTLYDPSGKDDTEVVTFAQAFEPNQEKSNSSGTQAE